MRARKAFLSALSEGRVSMVDKVDLVISARAVRRWRPFRAPRVNVDYWISLRSGGIDITDPILAMSRDGDLIIDLGKLVKRDFVMTPGRSLRVHDVLALT